MKEWLAAIFVLTIVTFSGLRQEAVSRWLSRSARMSFEPLQIQAFQPTPDESPTTVAAQEPAADGTLANTLPDDVDVVVARGLRPPAPLEPAKNQKSNQTVL